MITISNQAADGQQLQASFLPDKGMNMISYRKGEREVIDQTTRDQLDDRYAGMGPLIGPHFHRRPDHLVPPVPHEERFPHIARVKARGSHDPFTHGIARYAPWKVEATESSFRAELSGEDEWNGIALKELEGQMFHMWYRGEMRRDGLVLELGIKSDADSLVGFHTYYALHEGQGIVTATVQNEARFVEGYLPIPTDWPYDENKILRWDIAKREADYGFQPFPDRLYGEITLETGGKAMQISYSSPNEENSWQLWHPPGASFVCIEPLSAKNPRKPILTVSSLSVRIEIL